MKIYLLCLVCACSLLACQEDLVLKELPNQVPDYVQDVESVLDLPPVLTNYETDLPDYLKAVGLRPALVNDAKVTLGRVLFYDRNLSQDRVISCASCHKQSLAFSDDQPVSRGIHGARGVRNSMPLGNVASFSAHYDNFNGSKAKLLWDNRAADVAEQSTLAFINLHEMGLSMEAVVSRIHEQAYYAHLWQQAYGHFEVNKAQVLECLSAFVGAISAHRSKFDVALEKASGDINLSGTDTDTIVAPIYYGNTDTTITVVATGLPGFTAEENRGRDLFVANCSKCHSPIRPFQEVLEACNGLDMVYQDNGKGALTGQATDMGVFKSPSLRNIALTAPYMHDGRFNTLKQVVDFYSASVKPHPNLHPEVKNLFLSESDKWALVRFMETMTDFSITTDERFSNPFK